MEESKILSTTDYDTFHRVVGNRKIVRERVEILKKSICERNLLHLKPIICNKQFSIIDGQHRLQAAKELSLPIYYVIDQQSEDDSAIVILNRTQSNWLLEDYVDYYAENGKPDYLQLKKFSKECSISYPICAILLGYKRRKWKSHIVDGGFMFYPEKAEEGRGLIAVYRDFLANLVSKGCESYKIFATFSFLEAICLNEFKVPPKLFFENLFKIRTLIKHSSSFNGYLIQFDSFVLN